MAWQHHGYGIQDTQHANWSLSVVLPRHPWACRLPSLLKRIECRNWLVASSTNQDASTGSPRSCASAPKKSSRDAKKKLLVVQGDHDMPAREKKDAPWVSAMAEFEGLPLALRVRPAADFPANRTRYPRVALVSHALSQVTSNGLPEASYNDLLADFDQEVHTFIERGGDGLVVLVETFAGKRNYYAYVADDARLSARV